MNPQRSKVIIILATVISFGIGAAILYGNYSQEETFSQSIKKAVILDQLYNDFPNDAFQDKAIEYLESAGYQIDVFRTDEITVDFYKELPEMNYEFIVLRTHGGPGHGHGSTTLTTGEKYKENKHLNEIFNAQVGVSVPIIRAAEVEIQTKEFLLENSYFDINSTFVENGMQGRFSDSILVIGGCSAMNSTVLAESFVSRGMSSVVGWNGLVGDRDNDRITLEFLKEVLVNDVTVDDAVYSVMENYHNSIEKDSTLLHYSDEK